MAILADSQWGYSPSEKSFKAFFRSDIVKPGVHVCPGCHMSPGEVTSVPRLDWARLSAINGPEMIWKVWAVIHAGRLLANMEEVEMLKVKLSWIFDIPAAAALPGPVPTTRHPPSPATGAYDPIMHGHYNYYTLHSNHHSKILKKCLSGQVVTPNDCPHELGISPRGLGRVQTGEQQSGLGRVAGWALHIIISTPHITTSTHHSALQDFLLKQRAAFKSLSKEPKWCFIVLISTDKAFYHHFSRQTKPMFAVVVWSLVMFWVKQTVLLFYKWNKS